MKVNSLAFRLFATAAGWSLIVLPLAAFAISSLYRQDEQQAFDQRIRLLLTLIVADSLEQGAAEPAQPKGTGEPQFAVLHSGWYWQIKPLAAKRGQKAPGKRIVSASLASETLAIPSDRVQRRREDNFVWANVRGPLGESLRVAELVQALGPEKTPKRFSYAVAGPLDEVNQAVATLRTRLLVSLALAGLGLMAVTWFQVRFGLLPLRVIEKGLAKIRSGGAVKLEGDLPLEIEPLQSELNALIDSNQNIIDRARTQVGNLAHALKTPLAVITNEAHEHKGPFADKVIEQTKIMSNQVSHYLDRAQMAARVGVIGRKSDVLPVVEALARVLTKIHGGREIEFRVDCPRAVSFQGEKQDLEEALGNLMDNAGKWAKSVVEITVRELPADARGHKQLRIRIEDDGPGLTAAQRAEAVKRGRRLDETVPGSGLGLSIVADLAQSYHGALTLGLAAGGGLRADLVLPAV